MRKAESHHSPFLLFSLLILLSSPSCSSRPSTTTNPKDPNELESDAKARKSATSSKDLIKDLKYLGDMKHRSTLPIFDTWGPGVVPGLIELLNDKSNDRVIRTNAACVLGNVDPYGVFLTFHPRTRGQRPPQRPPTEAEKALTESIAMALIHALKDEKSSVREAATSSLGLIHRNCGLQAQTIAKAVPIVTEALKDTESLVRVEAGFTLWSLTTRAEKAIPVLVEALKDEDYELRSAAGYALARIGETAEEAVLRLAEALEDENPEVRESAAYSLSRLKWNEDQRDYRMWRVRTTRVTKPILEAVISALVKALRDERERTILCAASAIGNIGIRAEKAAPALIEALKFGLVDVVHASVSALGNFGPKTSLLLIEALKEKDLLVRAGAAVALLKINLRTRMRLKPSTVAQCDAVFVEALNNEDKQIRIFTVYSLEELGQNAVSSGRGTQQNSAIKAEKALIELVVAALITALKDKDRWLRESAAKALGKIGHKAKNVVSAAIVTALTRALKDRDKYVRKAAQAALKKMQKK